MKIEAVVVSLNYGDYLAHTLESLMAFADAVQVVTSPDDDATMRVSYAHKTTLLTTRAFQQYGGTVNKGAAINEGLGWLKRQDWLLIIDADIYVPSTLRGFIESARLDESRLYGVDRRNCAGYDNFLRCRESGEWGTLPLMRRVSISGGQPPPGYFQLFHSSMIPHGPWYEDTYRYADRTDMTFARRFDRREYLPAWVVHLDAGTDHAGGTNWRGRKSPPFGLRESRLT